MDEKMKNHLIWRNPTVKRKTANYICRYCKINLLKSQKDFWRRKEGVPSRSKATVVEWDDIRQAPVFKNGIIARKQDEKRTPEGCYKKKEKPRDKRITDERKKKELMQCIVENREENIMMYKTKKMGFGVKAMKKITKDSFVATYVGERISKAEAAEREVSYAANGKGCYVYHFRWNEKVMCIDATDDDENKTLGRLINHSKLKPNLYANIETINSKPYIFFKAKRDIRPHTQLLYDYNDEESGLLFMSTT